MWMWQETLLRNFVTFGVNLTCFAPWLPWQRSPFWIFSNPNSCHTLRWIFLQSLMKFDERNPPFFVSMATAAKFAQPIPIFLAYLVPLDVRRVTCYDHFCVFQFFSILAVSMATAAILKKINPSQHNFTWHMLFLQGFIKFDQGISEKLNGQKCVDE